MLQALVAMQMHLMAIAIVLHIGTAANATLRIMHFGAFS
jgi:hypothetical protein